jgi:hypothetical protein
MVQRTVFIKKKSRCYSERGGILSADVALTRTNRCYHERSSRTNYVRSSIPHCNCTLPGLLQQKYNLESHLKNWARWESAIIKKTRITKVRSKFSLAVRQTLTFPTQSLTNPQIKAAVSLKSSVEKHFHRIWPTSIHFLHFHPPLVPECEPRDRVNLFHKQGKCCEACFSVGRW